jgi:nucleoside-diphosphate-sugar epimerase
MSTKGGRMKFGSCVIFGGAGFIGGHLAHELLEQKIADRIFLADIAPLRSDFPFLNDERVTRVHVDVREKISSGELPPHADLIVNLAAVHREPGHKPAEYFETNLLGAENVCAWAGHAGCERIIFTSSIAPYGPSEEEKSETSLPVPVTAYGSSKLAAEKIHIAWQSAAAPTRNLVIVRPGVVFGAGEGGNVTRLVKSLLRGYFFYMGNRQTRKSGGYVKELVQTMLWATQRQQAGVLLYNFSQYPIPTVQEYAETIQKVAGIRRRVFQAPYALLYPMSWAMDSCARLFGLNQPVNPTRLRKLIRSNNIVPAVLQSEQYQNRFDLESALRDWKSERPEDWR